MRGDIKLDGKDYLLIGETYQKSSQMELNPRFITGEPSLTDRWWWQYISLSDFSGGAGQIDHILKNAFYSSSNIIPSKNKLRLAPPVDTSEASSNTWLESYSGGLGEGTEIHCVHNGSIKLATDADIVALGLGTITALGSWKNILWIGVAEKLYRVDHYSSIADASFVANLDNWVDLTHGKILWAIVRKTGGYGLFRQGIDYVMDYSEGKIKLLSTGLTKEDTDYQIDYSYRTIAQVVCEEHAGSWTYCHGGYISGLIQLDHTHIIPGSVIAKGSDGAYYTDLLVDALTGKIRCGSPSATTLYISYLYEVITDVTNETVNGSHNAWLDLEHKNLESGMEMLKWEAGVGDNPDHVLIYEEGKDYILDKELGRIQCLSLGKMTNGETYYINYDYQNPDAIAGSTLIGAVTDGDIKNIIGYDKLYLGVKDAHNNSSIHISDGQSLQKNIDLGIFDLRDLAIWNGSLYLAGGRTIGSETRGQLYQYPQKLLLEIKDGTSADWTITKLLSSEELYFAGRGIYKWNGQGYYNYHTLTYQVLSLAEYDEKLYWLGNDKKTYDDPTDEVAEGYLETSEMAGNTSLIVKSWYKVYLEFEDEITDMSLVSLAVRKYIADTDEESLILRAETNTVLVADLPSSYESPSLVAKIILKKGAPKLRKMLLQFLPVALKKKSFAGSIKAENSLVYRDGKREQRTGKQIEDDLWSIKESSRIVKYVDVDGKEYNVIMNEISHMSLGLSEENKSEGIVSLSLLEV